MERYLINYLKEHASDAIVKKYVDFFKIELDWYIYNYGEHISKRYHRNAKLCLKERLYKKYQRFSAQYCPLSFRSDSKNILSSLHLSDKKLLVSMGFNPFSSILQPVGKTQIIGDRGTLYIDKVLREKLAGGSFTDIYNETFFYELEDYQSNIIRQYQQLDLRALFLYTDQYFASKYLIDIFKQINRPSFVFSHGLPGIYSKDVDNRTDYLMVWGEKIKENYIKIGGFSPDKIKVVGNVKYRTIWGKERLKNSLEDVLVIPCSSALWHQHQWNTPTMIDRSMIVLYLYQVQNVLLRCGVKHARFRPHPSLDKSWVYGFIDKTFYEMDNQSLFDSIHSSSLVIGASSTTFLEVLMYNVNYLLYEPVDENGVGICNTKRVPPFDGTESNLQIAKNEEELEYMIKNRYQTPRNVLEGYMQPLDLSVLKTLVK